MKKSIPLLMLALLLLMPHTVMADVIFEPVDSFFNDHRDDCVYVGRNYLTNAADGSAVIWEDPESGRSMHAVRNGISIHITHIYTGDEASWGVVEYSVDAQGNISNSYPGGALVGWINMGDLLLEHDSKAFIDAHSAELQPYSGDYEAIVSAGEDTLLWSYPGSGVTVGTLYEPGSLLFEQAYTDAEGRLWGYIGYHYGTRDVWVCVSEPTNAAIPAANIPAIELHPAKPDSEVMKALGTKQAAPIKLKNSAPSSSITIILLVAAVTILTALLIRILMKKKNPSRG